MNTDGDQGERLRASIECKVRIVRCRFNMSLPFKSYGLSVHEMAANVTHCVASATQNIPIDNTEL